MPDEALQEKSSPSNEPEPKPSTGRAAQREENHRVVIIGSGVGGSVAAYRLSEAGVENLVLERGRRWPITPSADTFPHVPSLDKRLIWLDDTPPTPHCAQLPWLSKAIDGVAQSVLPTSTGLMDVLLHRNLTVICGAGVGGGTLIYGGILPQPRPGPFEAVFPGEIDYAEMDEVYYPRTRRRMSASTFPRDLLSHPRYRTERTWVSALTRTGLTTEEVPSTFDFDVIRAELSGERKPSATVGQYIFTGCDSGAKLSMDRTYLARAEATGKTVVRPLHKVTGVTHESDGRYRVAVERLATDGRLLERLVVRCDKLIMAAGGVHTPRMLVTARDTGALPGLNEHVGAQWGTNGDQLPIIKTFLQPTGRNQGGPPPLLARNSDATAMVTAGGLPIPVESRFMLIAGIGIPDRYGKWVHSASAGRAHLQWSANSDATAQRDALALTRTVARHIPYGAAALDPNAAHPLILHPLGGVAIGKATDMHGRLHGHDGLYCLDSALMPGSTAAVNPALTIAAIAERCLDHVISDFTD